MDWNPKYKELQKLSNKKTNISVGNWGKYLNRKSPRIRGLKVIPVRVAQNENFSNK